MGLEKDVLGGVAKVLKSDNRACFQYGTLFVTCTPREAAKIETVLNKMALGGVLVTAQSDTGEFSFDFV
jgi:hypothetical protein